MSSTANSRQSVIEGQFLCQAVNDLAWISISVLAMFFFCKYRFIFV